jgi:hypothetical protein
MSSVFREGSASQSTNFAPVRSRRSTACHPGGVNGFAGRSSTAEIRASPASLHINNS